MTNQEAIAALKDPYKTDGLALYSEAALDHAITMLERVEKLREKYVAETIGLEWSLRTWSLKDVLHYLETGEGL